MELFLYTVDYHDRHIGKRGETHYLVKVTDGIIKSVVLAERTASSPWCFNELFALDRSTLDSALRFNRKQGRLACLYRAGYRILKTGYEAYQEIFCHPNNRATLIPTELKERTFPTLAELCLRRCPRSQLNRTIVQMFDYFRSCPFCGDFYHPERRDYCCRFQYRRLKSTRDKVEPPGTELLRFWEEHSSDGSEPITPCCLFPDPTVLPLLDPPRFVY